MQPNYRQPAAEYRADAPRSDRATSIGEAMEEVLGAFAARQGARPSSRPAYSPVFVAVGSMSDCGSVMTR